MIASVCRAASRPAPSRLTRSSREEQLLASLSVRLILEVAEREIETAPRPQRLPGEMPQFDIQLVQPFSVLKRDRRYAEVKLCPVARHRKRGWKQGPLGRRKDPSALRQHFGTRLTEVCANLQQPFGPELEHGHSVQRTGRVLEDLGARRHTEPRERPIKSHAVNRRPNGPPYRRAKGTPCQYRARLM